MEWEVLLEFCLNFSLYKRQKKTMPLSYSFVVSLSDDNELTFGCVIINIEKRVENEISRSEIEVYSTYKITFTFHTEQSIYNKKPKDNLSG